MSVELIVTVVIGLVAAWIAFVGLLWLLRPRDTRLGDAVRVVPDILRLARGLIADRSVPPGVRVALVVLAAWLVNPVDLVPEFVPVIGPVDDIVVAVLVLRYVRRRLGDDELRRRWPGTEAGYAVLSRVLGRGG